jgi:hypothetical protein
MSEIEKQKIVLQNIFISVNLEKLRTEPSYKKNIEDAVTAGVAGVFIEQGEETEIGSRLEQLQAIAETPLLVVARISTGLPDTCRDGTDFPHISAIKRTGELAKSFKIGKAIASEANDFGINMLLLNQNTPENIDSQDDVTRSFTLEMQRGINSGKIFTGTLNHPEISSADFFDSGWSFLYSKSIGLPNDTERTGKLPEFYFIEDGAVEKVISVLENCSISIIDSNNFNNLINLMSSSEFDDEIHKKLIRNAQRLKNMKRKCGLLPRFARPDTAHSTNMSHMNTALKIAVEACEKVDTKAILPLDEEGELAVFSFVKTDKDVRSATRFSTMTAQAMTGNCDFAYLTVDMTNKEVNDMAINLPEEVMSLFLLFDETPISDDDFKNISRIINGLTTENNFLVNLGHEDNTKDICPNNHISTFSDSFPSLAAAVTLLFGRESALDQLS